MSEFPLLPKIDDLRAKVLMYAETLPRQFFRTEEGRRLMVVRMLLGCARAIAASDLNSKDRCDFARTSDTLKRLARECDAFTNDKGRCNLARTMETIRRHTIECDAFTKE